MTEISPTPTTPSTPPTPPTTPPILSDPAVHTSVRGLSHVPSSSIPTPTTPRLSARPRPHVVPPAETIRHIVSRAIAEGADAEARLLAHLHVGRNAVATVDPDAAQPTRNSASNSASSSTNFVGLSRQQRKFLMYRALTETDSEAVRLCGGTLYSFNKWKRTSPTFMRAYSALWVDPASFTITMLDNLLPKAADVLEDILMDGQAKNADRLKAVEIVYKSKGMLKGPESEDINEYDRRLAVVLVERGISVTPQLQRYAEESLPLPNANPSHRPTVIDADFTNLTQVDTQPD